MSVLSRLENELGLPEFDFSSFEETDFNIYEGVDYSSPSPSYPASEQELEKYVEEKIMDKEEEYKLSGFNAKNVADSMGIPSTNITNLFLHVLEIYKRTNKDFIKSTCKQILDGLYNNNISRDKCNQIINKLNRMCNECII